MLLQEVDLDASRTFGIDQVSAIAKVLPEHFHARAINFKVPWIPYPLLTPIGRVNSGLHSLSRFKLSKAVRHQLPGDYPWPVRVFHLKRCLHELRFPASDAKDWVVLHLHLSAFDAGGHLRKQQMAYLRELILKLEGEGQHVIVGGDWNQAFPGVGDHHFPHQAKIPDWFQKAPADWAPEGWKWVFDEKVPSLRATNKPYVPGENFVTSVDGFLVSPEIEVQKVECVDLGFVHADHQPVRIRVSLKTVE
jgi:endonuclease/exonuclease/phosphatase family metal-dependent hydrolase